MDVKLIYKWEHNPDDAQVMADGSMKWFTDNLTPSDDDAAAIACARKIAEDTGGVLTAVTIGNGDVSWALARGAAGALSVDDYTPGLDDAETAAKLANAVKAAGKTDVVIMGDAQDHAGVAPVVAALLDFPLVSGVNEVHADSGELVAKRVTSSATETIRFSAPAVVSVAAVDVEKVFPSMKQKLAAKKLPVDRLTAADSGEVATSTLAIESARVPLGRTATIFDGTPAEAADALAAALRAVGVL